MKKIYFLWLIVLVSCGGNSIEDDFKKFNSSPIKIPMDMLSTYNGKDSIIDGFKDIPTKFIVYMDSTKCASCMIKKLYVWDKYIDFAKATKGKLAVWFILSPKSDDGMQLTKIALVVNKIDYPIFIDSSGVFERLNPHLPKDDRFHTFMIDGDGKLMFAGNPLLSEDINKMFFEAAF